MLVNFIESWSVAPEITTVKDMRTCVFMDVSEVLHKAAANWFNRKHICFVRCLCDREYMHII